MAAMEELCKPVPAIRAIAIAKDSSSRTRRPLLDVCSQLRISNQMHTTILAMASSRHGHLQSSSYGVAMPDPDTPCQEYSAQDSSANVPAFKDSEIRAKGDSLDLNAGNEKSVSQMDELRAQRWKMASELAFMYQSGLVQWVTDDSDELQDSVGLDPASSKLLEDEILMSGFTKGSGRPNENIDLNLNEEEEHKDDDLFQGIEERVCQDPQEAKWQNMMMAMFSSQNEKPDRLFPGVWNPTELMCRLQQKD